MKALLRWIGCVLLAGVALQLFFVLRIAAMAAIDPQSTSFQRSEIWAQVAAGDGRVEQRRLQVWIDHIGAVDVCLAAIEVEHVAEVVHRNDTGGGIAVGRRQQVVGMPRLGEHQAQARQRLFERKSIQLRSGRHWGANSRIRTGR